jgi:7-cyano-7-deazaguanine synthase
MRIFAVQIPHETKYIMHLPNEQYDTFICHQYLNHVRFCFSGITITYSVVKKNFNMKNKTPKAVILLSGGIDSTTCLGIAKSQNFECYTLSFDYGQRHNFELKAAKKIAAHFAIEEHRVIKLNIGELGGSALTDKNIVVPEYQNSNEIPVTYVPARNTIFLSIALGWAEILEANDIFIGVSAIDYSGYPDCRPEFIKAFQNLADLATKMGIKGNFIKINTPLINLSKAETIKLGQNLGIDYSMTVTCYQVDGKGRACGKCDSCALRIKGFKEAEIIDPTQYQ